MNKNKALWFRLGVFSLFLSVVSLFSIDYYRNPMSIHNLIKTHPRLQYVCDNSSGCFFVTVICRHYNTDGDDDSSLVSLRGVTAWEIVDVSGHYGIALKGRYEIISSDVLIERAIDDYLKTVAEEAGKKKVDYMEPKDPTSESCGLDCK